MRRVVEARLRPGDAVVVEEDRHGQAVRQRRIGRLTPVRSAIVGSIEGPGAIEGAADGDGATDGAALGGGVATAVGVASAATGADGPDEFPHPPRSTTRSTTAPIRRPDARRDAIRSSSDCRPVSVRGGSVAVRGGAGHHTKVTHQHRTTPDRITRPGATSSRGRRRRPAPVR